MVSSHLGFFVALLFVLSYVKVATSIGAANNVTAKMMRCRENERRALLDFKEGLILNGDNNIDYGDIVSTWGKGKEEDCCYWRGIRCSKRTGHVTILSIRGYYNYSEGTYYGVQGKLTGEIPQGLANLAFLAVLDLSNNNLLGKIPSSTQLQSFNASAYGGNDKLCGPPLSSVCPCEETNVLPPTPVRHGSDEHNKVGLYVSVVCGFVTGFWGLIGPMLLRRTWRHAYFRLLQKIYDWIYVTAMVNMARLRRKIQG